MSKTKVKKYVAAVMALFFMFSIFMNAGIVAFAEEMTAVEGTTLETPVEQEKEEDNLEDVEESVADEPETLEENLKEEKQEDTVEENENAKAENIVRAAGSVVIDTTYKLSEGYPEITQYKRPAARGHGLYLLINDGGTMRVGYCLDYGLSMHGGTSMNPISFDKSFDAKTQRLLKAALTFGYHETVNNPTEIQKARYAATELTIWNITEGLYKTSKGEKAAQEYFSYMKEEKEAHRYFKELEKKIETFEKLPSFVGKNYVLKYNSERKRYETIVQDTNNVSDKVTLKGNVEIGLEAVPGTKDQFYLFTDKELVKEEKIDVTRNDKDGGLMSCVIFGTAEEGFQRVGMLDLESRKIYTKGSLNVKTELASLKINKVDAETGESVSQIDGASFEGVIYDLFNKDLYIEGADETHESFVKSLVLNTEGEAELTELNVGNYLLIERAAPEGYVKSEPIEVSFPIADAENPMEAVVEVKEELVRGDLFIHKQEKGSEKPLEGIEFTVTSKRNGEKIVLVTDENGDAGTRTDGPERGALPYGVYTVEETKPLEGYRSLEPFEISIQNEAEELTYTLENEKIPEENKTPIKTGDSTNWMFLVVLLMISGGVVAYSSKIRNFS